MNLHKFILPGVCVLLVCALTGCPLIQTSWERHFGSNDGDDGANAIAATIDGGFVVAGWSEPTHEEGDNVHVAKLNFLGMVEWEASYGDERDDEANSIVAAKDGGYVIAGTFGAGSDTSDGFLMKLDWRGKEVWRRVYDSGGIDEALNAEATADGGYIVGLSLDEHGKSQAVAVKTDASGNEQWRVTAAEGAHTVRAIACADGNFLLGWWSLPEVAQVQTEEEAKANAGDGVSVPIGRPKSADASLVGLLKLGAGGAEIWRQTIGDAGHVQMIDLCQASDGGFAIAGQSGFMQQDSQACLWKTDGAGALLWKQTYGGEGREVINAVKATKDDGFVLIGELMPVSNHPHVYMMKTDAFGSMRWERAYGGDDRDIGYDVVQTRGGGFCLAATSESFEAATEQEHAEFYVVKTDEYGHMWDAEEPIPAPGAASPSHYDLPTFRGTSHVLSPSTANPGKLHLRIEGLDPNIIAHRVLNSDEIQEAVNAVHGVHPMAEVIRFWNTHNFDQDPPEAALLTGASGTNPHFMFVRLSSPQYDAGANALEFEVEMLETVHHRSLNLLDDDIVPVWQKDGGAYLFTEPPSLQNVTDSSFSEEVLNCSGTPVFVFYWAEWAGPCRIVTPSLTELADEYAGLIKVVRIDIDNNPQVPTQYNVRSIPAIHVFKDGQHVDTLIGAVPKSALEKFIQRNLY